MATLLPERVSTHLWRPREEHEALQTYAIVDAARDARIYPGLVAAHAEYRCLYRGVEATALAAVAPYLVSLRPDTPLTHWLLDLGWGNSWGIWMASSTSLQVLHRHFRRFLMVYDPDGNPLYFRYYDPRVLRVYLPTCTAEELQAIFGPVRCYYVEGEDGVTFLELALAGAGLTQRRIRLDA